MKRFPLLHAPLISLVSLAACAAPPPSSAPAPGQESPTLRPFGSEAELAAFGEALERDIERRDARLRRGPPPPPPPPPGAESITSTQTEGVDEGGIVKVHGDHLVVLRRGRLFTVRIGGDALRPVAAVDAFAPGIDPAHSWYDEMLVSGDNVVVIGYSYGRGGTELGVFRIGADGSLAHRGTYHLRSADYYSSRNYASRLVGGRLVFYAPVPVRRDLFASLPAVRRWGGPDSAWVRTATVQRIYRPAGPLRADDLPMVHAVTSCDVGGGDLRCESTALLGPAGAEFYVSGGSVYLWTEAYAERNTPQSPRSMLYRLPLDGSAPTALRVGGLPIDQFSFLESPDAHLNVLARVGNDAWRGAHAQPGLALLRVPLSALTDGSRAAPAEAYRTVPPLPRDRPAQNRYVGDWLLYGAGAGWGTSQPGGGTAYAVRWAGGEASELALPHPVDRIEAMGRAAVLVGGDGQGLHFTSVRLDGASAQPVDRYTRADVSQGETRSHGFFYRAEGEDGGVLGLPIRGAPEGGGYAHLRRGSGSLVFLRSRALRLEPLGELAADSGAADVDDACRASCVDWYGNARPIFLRGRTFALLGYELVEGAMEGGRVRELRRVSFAPRVAPARFAGDWTFTESIGHERDPYHCRSQGTMRLDQDGAAVWMTYRQTGQCTIGGQASSSAGEGSGRGTVSGGQMRLDVQGCSYRGELQGPASMVGNLRCTVRDPGGAERVVHGTWQARRAGG